MQLANESSVRVKLIRLTVVQAARFLALCDTCFGANMPRLRTPEQIDRAYVLMSSGDEPTVDAADLSAARQRYFTHLTASGREFTLSLLKEGFCL